MSDITEKAIQKSTDYYNSSDTDTYYRKIWGGESIHVGIFDKPGISIREAARRAHVHADDCNLREDQLVACREIAGRGANLEVVA